MGSKLMYKLMVLIFKIQDFFSTPGDILLSFHTKNGDTVVDYGCGPGRYVQRASGLVGDTGKVIAADISEVAIDNVMKRIQKHGLKNVFPVLLDKSKSRIPENFADVIYALDMFHQVNDPADFLSDIHKIIKKSGYLYLEDGHQPRIATIKKVKLSGMWQIDEEYKEFLRLKPLEISLNGDESNGR